MSFRILFILIIFTCIGKSLSAQNKGWIPAGKLNIYYEKSGTGDPIVFLHAGYMDHRMWNAQVAFFKKQYTVITIDQPRHGLTTGSDTSLLIADVIRVCLDSLHIKKATLAGLSLGGVSMTDFAIAYPERVNKLIFVCAGLNGFDKVIPVDSITMKVFTRTAAAGETHADTAIARVFTENWADGPFRDPKQMDPVTRTYVYEQVIKTSKDHAQESWINFKDNPKAAFEIGRIQNKSLIICADKDVPYIEASAKYIRDHVKGSKLVVFKGSAHMVNMEQPQKFNRVLDAFLKGSVVGGAR